MSKISAKELKTLKEKHPQGALLRVPNGKTFVDLFLKEMDRTTYEAASGMYQQDPLKASEVMLKNLTVGGDLETVVNNFDMFRSASDGLAEFIEVKKSVLIR